MKITSSLLLLLPLVALASTEVDRHKKARSNAHRSGKFRRGVRGLQDGSGKGGKGDSSSSSKSSTVTSSGGKGGSAVTSSGGKGGSTVTSSGGKGGSTVTSSGGKGGSSKTSSGGKGGSSKTSSGGKGGSSKSSTPVNPAPPAPAVPVDVPVAAPVVDPTAGATETTIGGFVSGTSGLESLQAALVRAGLSGALSGAGDGPFTLFAPNNAAFQLLPDFFIDLLFVNDEFIPHLQDLLLYHILSGEFFGSDLELLAGVDGVSLPTVNTELIVVASPPLTVQGISVITPNNDVANGVLHIIDNVLAPSWVFNFISQRVIANTATSTLNALLVMAEIDLGQAGALTLLAPTNAAFDALGIPALEFLTDPDNVNALTLILAYHVIIGVFTTAELSEGLQIPTALGTTTVIVSVGQSTAFFNQAEIVDFDILALNGVVHTINAVLNPENSPTRR